MSINEIEEIKEMRVIEVEPGKTTGLIKREGNEHLVLIAVQGCGVIKRQDIESGGNILSYNTVARLDFRNGDEFLINVLEVQKESLKVVLLRMELTVNL